MIVDRTRPDTFRQMLRKMGLSELANVAPERALRGEERLWCAVLLRGLLDYAAGVADSAAWLASGGREAPGDLLSICDLLDLDPVWVRAAGERGRQQKEARLCAVA